MKVIQHGYEKEVVCPKCKATIVYDSSDIHLVGDMEGDWDYCVTCPDCGKNIRVI